MPEIHGPAGYIMMRDCLFFPISVNLRLPARRMRRIQQVSGEEYLLQARHQQFREPAATPWTERVDLPEGWRIIKILWD